MLKLYSLIFYNSLIKKVLKNLEINKKLNIADKKLPKKYLIVA